jgi:ubiquinone/menaquinone biosynthesis C-methylase UbiE
MKNKKKLYFQLMSIIHEKLYGLLRNPYRVLRSAGLKAGQRVLEVGCGPGFFTIPAAKLVGEQGSVLALDVNPFAVEHTSHKIQETGTVNAKVVQTNATDTGQPDKHFDLAFVFGLAHPIGNLDAIWIEIHRLLTARGTLAVEGRLQPPLNIFRLVHRQGRINRYTKIR